MPNVKMKVPSGRTGAVQTEYGDATISSDGTVTVDARAAADLLNAGFLPQDDDLPVGLSIKGGATTVSSAQATANQAVIATGLASITTFLARVFRSGVDVTADAAFTVSNGNLTVADGASTYDMTAGDVIRWIAYGAE